MIRIANAQGFWGDWLEAPVRTVEDGPIDYLTLDYLAEVTMSILQKLKQRDPGQGYARDFPPLMGKLARRIKERGVCVIANAGGVNPVACAREVRRLAPELKVAVVLGDDVFDRVDEFLANGYEMRNLDTGKPLSTVREKLLSANAYLGAFPIAEALGTGADVVITGRCADAALALAPMIQRFGWSADQYDLLAAGMAAGHIIECGTQCTGGNYGGDWQHIEMANIGYPIVEAEPDGTFVVTKHPNTGGLVSSHTVKEQLVYEIGDPARYMTPDVIVDFTSLTVRDEAKDRVRVTGTRGLAPTEFLKLSMNWAAGWKATGTLVYSWPDALEKACRADEIVRTRIRDLGLEFETVYTEYFGVNACHGPAAASASDPPEVQVRIGVRGHNKAHVERFTRELVPLVLSGPPSATGYGEGRPQVKEIVAYWPALLPRTEIRPAVEVVE